MAHPRRRIFQVFVVPGILLGLAACWSKPPDVRAQTVYIGALGEAVMITSKDPRPFTIRQLTVNGEWHPKYGSDGLLQLPQKMTEGATLGFMLNALAGPASPYSYNKDIVTLDVETSLGTVTLDWDN